MRRTSHRQQLRDIAPWGVLFATLLVAVWAVTRSRQAPPLILIALLYLITINFTPPLPHGSTSLVPIVSVSSLLILGLPATASLLACSILLAAAVAPLWAPLWETAKQAPFSWIERLGMGLVYLAALSISGRIFQQLGGVAPLLEANSSDLNSFIGLSAGYGSIYVVASLILWILCRKPWHQFPFLLAIATGFLPHAISFLGADIYLQNGLPAFVIYSLIVAGVAVIVWLAGQRRQMLRQQFMQLSILNKLGQSLRETMDLDTIVLRTGVQVLELIIADNFLITIADESQRWDLQYHIRIQENGRESLVKRAAKPDDFVKWVAERSTVLQLHSGNIHFAERHQLKLPDPVPAAWLGVPLTAGDQLIGVMSLQNHTPGFRFDRWSQEMVMAIAGQASSVIRNARLYGETVRLYDLTDAALSQKLKQLHALLDTMEEGVLMLDTHSQVALINPMAAQLLGNADTLSWHNQSLDKGILSSIGLDSTSFASLTEHLATGSGLPTTDAVIQVPAAAGGQLRPRYVRRIDSAVTNETKELVGWLMVFRDITEEMETAELRSDLTQMIVHDLRNPLATLSSMIELANRYVTGTPPHNTKAELQLNSASRVCSDMLDMVDSMMDISRMEANQVVVHAEAMRLPPLVEQIASRLGPLADSREIEFCLNYPAELPAVWGDEEMLRRVLINLLDNSLKFTPSGGSIGITLRAEPAPNLEREPGVHCTIADSGPGVPAPLRQQVFVRFVRTNPGGNREVGLGLGLTFCKLAVEAHGGRIWIEESPSGGSHFVFVIPGIPLFQQEVPLADAA